MGVTNGIEGAAMQLLWAAKEHQVQVNTRTRGFRYIGSLNSLVEAGAPELMLGKGLA